MTDLLTGVFYASSQPLEVGQNFVMPVVDAMHNVPVTMKVEGREEIKTPLGTFKTIRVQPTADAGVVKNRGNIWIWYTDDDRHLPVQMRARLFWGTITFRLDRQREQVGVADLLITDPDQLLHSIPLAHQPLQPGPVDQVERQFLVGKHGQRSLSRVSATISEASSTVSDESCAITCITMLITICRRRILRLSSFNSSGD